MTPLYTNASNIQLFRDINVVGKKQKNGMKEYKSMLYANPYVVYNNFKPFSLAEPHNFKPFSTSHNSYNGSSVIYNLCNIVKKGLPTYTIHNYIITHLDKIMY